MNDENHFQELKEHEIKRLTTPLTRKKIKGKPDEVYDFEGNLVACTNNKDYVLEPNDGLLSNDEILKYAPKSKKASNIRLKRGRGSISDKIKVYSGQITAIIIGAMFPLTFGFMYSIYAGLLVLILVILGFIYFLYIYDFRGDETENCIHQSTNKKSNNDDLLLLFESKEKIAREMIEKKFPAPQMTNTKFNAVLDNCKEVVESQVEILNALTPTEKTKNEIESRKKLIKHVISKIDDLTNELILSEENNLEDVVGDMDELIDSVKEYE